MDPKQINLARRYARAYVRAFGQTLDLSDCARIDYAVGYLRTHPTVLYFFSWVGLTQQDRDRMMRALCAQLAINEDFMRLIDLLGQHKRMWILPDVLSGVRDEIYRVFVVTPFVVTSFPELDERERIVVRDFLSHALGMQVVCSFKSDATLLSGVRAQSVGFLWERSIARRLNQARRALLEHGQYCVGGM